MTTDDKLVNIAERFPIVFDAGRDEGKKLEYDRFWDAYQENGNRTDYSYAFAGYGWNNEIFKPKYDIKPSGRCVNMFYDANVSGDFAQTLENLGITLDLSEITRFGYGFYYCRELTRIGEINLTQAIDTTTYVFADCRILETIDKITISENNTFSNWFYNCNALKEIRFEGVIANSIDLHWSTKLSAESYKSILDCMIVSVTNQTLTIPATAEAVYDAKYGSGKWAEREAEKNNLGWAFSYI